MLSIVLVAWELPEDSKFPSIIVDLPETVKYASLWTKKDPQWVKDRKIFWTLMEMNVHMAINCNPWLSLTNFDNLQEYAEFKADFRHISIRAQRTLSKSGTT